MSLDNTATTTETCVDYASRLHELDEAVLLARQALEFHTPPDPLHSESLDNLADALSTRFRDGGQIGDLDEAISLYRQALELRPSPDPLRPTSLNNLSKVLLNRFENGAQPSDLEEALSLPKQALVLQSPTDPHRSSSLHNLAFALFRQFQKTGQRHDLDESVSKHQQALELRELPHPLRPDSLGGLGDALWTRFSNGGDQIDLDRAISLHREALELRPLPHPLRSVSLHGLALALWTRSKDKGGHQSDLDDAALLHRQALELRPSPHPLRSNSLTGLAIVLLVRFEQEGCQSDLNEAISLERQCLDLQLPTARRCTSLVNLGGALGKRFEQDGHQRDLDEAIFLQRQSLELLIPSARPLYSSILNNLATALKIRFLKTGHQSDLDEAITLQKQTLELITSLHPLQSMFLSNLATLLFTRFEQRGHQSDLDEAFLLQRQALELRPSPHPLRFMSLNNLANFLTTRFKQEGRQSDLNEAIFLLRQALELLSSPHPDRSMSLNNLAGVLRTKFEQDGHQSDLDETISLHRQALELHTSSHFLRSSYLNDLAAALQTRFGREGRRVDLDEAILLNREALNLRNLSHPRRSESLISLANALRTRFEQDGHKTDCNEAVSMYREALELRPSPHPGQSQSLYELGIGLIHAHSFTGNNSSYLDEAMESFCAATHCLNQPASLRLRIAHTWIKHGVLHTHRSAIDAYDAALHGLPKLAALSFDVKSRQEALLADSNGLARDAARFAIQAGKVEKAVEFLEAGRAVFWSQFLSLRSPLEQLREISPELADRLRATATALELGSHRNTLADTSENRKKLVLDQETTRLNRLNEEWSKAIDNVRQLDGFEHFLQPRTLSELQVAASAGPVVILIENNEGLPTQELQTLVHFIRLASPDSLRFNAKNHSEQAAEFPPAMVETLRNWMKLKEERGMRYQGQEDSDTVFKYVLDTLWNEVVKPVINILHLKKSVEPPVVQWCPTGLFSFLPIHAAGCYNDRLAIECASDYFISSYTPTVGSLLTRYQTSTEPFRMMVVIQSQDLPSTQKELERIEQHVSDDLLVKFGNPGQSASVEAVASQLSDVAIVHFSCHGTQDRLNPLDSGLKLEDGYLRVSRIMKEKLQHGALAFLCACETAMGDDKLPDEAMSLGASLLFSGFRRVVATMWAMQDKDGPVIADAFYEELFRGPEGKPTREPDLSKSAYALHIAVRKLRAEKVSFSRWVPFIHMGK